MTLQGSWLSRIAEVLQADPAYVWPRQTLALTGGDKFPALGEVKEKIEKTSDDVLAPLLEGYDILNTCAPGSAACRRAWIRLSAYLQTSFEGWEERHENDTQCSPLEDIALLIDGSQTSTFQSWESTDIVISSDDQTSVKKVVKAGKDYIFPMLFGQLMGWLSAMGFGRRLQFGLGGGWGEDTCPLVAEAAPDWSMSDEDSQAM